jgi:hypothetical protein
VKREDKSLSALMAYRISAIGNALADRRGVPLIIGLVLVLLNFVCQFIPALGWFAEYNVLLHLGLVFSIGGALLSAAL